MSELDARNALARDESDEQAIRLVAFRRRLADSLDLLPCVIESDRSTWANTVANLLTTLILASLKTTYVSIGAIQPPAVVEKDTIAAALTDFGWVNVIILHGELKLVRSA